MLEPLARLPDGKPTPQVQSAERFRDLLTQAFRGTSFKVESLEAVAAPGRGTYAVCAEVVSRRLFSKSVRYAGFVIAGPVSPRIVGHIVIGTRARMVWTMEDEIEDPRAGDYRGG